MVIRTLCIYVMPQMTRLPTVTCVAHAAVLLKVLSADRGVRSATGRAVSRLISGDCE